MRDRFHELPIRLRCNHCKTLRGIDYLMDFIKYDCALSFHKCKQCGNWAVSING